jgi:hypothetical protein
MWLSKYSDMIFQMKMIYIVGFNEALSATSLTHPNIVNIFDVGEEGTNT